jgi:uncharacterized protein (TIGR03435 family)
MRALIVVTVACLACSAQDAPAAVAFEVATIKPSDPAGRPNMQTTGDRVDFRGLALRIPLGQAYGVRPIYVLGEDWLDTKFDIAAKIPAGATAQQVPEMLRALLTERFGVKMHTETRQMPVYVLTVAKGGFKLKELPPETPNAVRNAPGSMVNVGTLDSIGAAASFAGLRGPLINQTGLTGKYEVPLNPALIFAGGARNTIDDSDALARMREAVEPYGLNIDRARIPTTVVVIDHIEHTPTGN